MGLMIFLLSFFLSLPTFAVQRFAKEELEFAFHSEGMPIASCSHVPLKESGPHAPDLPWWFVDCGTRKFTVDAWFDITDMQGGLQSLRFMFHIKESVSSSGLKTTRFNTQTTDLLVHKTLLFGISSFLDVDNGLGDLQITARSK
jgi:hypothetical protein